MPGSTSARFRSVKAGVQGKVLDFLQVVAAVWGCLHGMLHLNLGLIRGLAGLRQNLHLGPPQWRKKCVSAQGKLRLTLCGSRITMLLSSYPHPPMHRAGTKYGQTIAAQQP